MRNHQIKCTETLFHCSGPPGPKSWSNHCSIVPVPPKKVIKPLFHCSGPP